MESTGARFYADVGKEPDSIFLCISFTRQTPVTLERHQTAILMCADMSSLFPLNPYPAPFQYAVQSYSKTFLYVMSCFLGEKILVIFS